MRQRRPALWGMLILGGLLFACPMLRAQDQLAGTYRCVSVAAGSQKGRCSSPPLVLRPDGSYQIWGEQGTYTVLGKFVVFSEAKKRGPGRLKSGREIVFEYFHRGRKHIVTFQRQEVPSPGAAFS